MHAQDPISRLTRSLKNLESRVESCRQAAETLIDVGKEWSYQDRQDKKTPRPVESVASGAANNIQQTTATHEVQTCAHARRLHDVACPECGCFMVPESGCWVCMSCGYSSCG